jgi:hypothetical protein
MAKCKNGKTVVDLIDIDKLFDNLEREAKKAKIDDDISERLDHIRKKYRTDSVKILEDENFKNFFANDKRSIKKAKAVVKNAVNSSPVLSLKTSSLEKDSVVIRKYISKSKIEENYFNKNKSENDNTKYNSDEYYEEVKNRKDNLDEQTTIFNDLKKKFEENSTDELAAELKTARDAMKDAEKKYHEYVPKNSVYSNIIITTKAIIDAIASEKDLMKRVGDKTKKVIFDSTRKDTDSADSTVENEFGETENSYHMFSTPYDRLTRIVGRSVLESQGRKITNMSKDEIDATYARLGKTELDRLIDLGLMETHENAFAVVSGNLVNDQGGPVTGGLSKKDTAKINKEDNYKVYKTKVITLNINTTEEDFGTFMSNITNLSKVLLPAEDKDLVKVSKDNNADNRFDSTNSDLDIKTDISGKEAIEKADTKEARKKAKEEAREKRKEVRKEMEEILTPAQNTKVVIEDRISGLFDGMGEKFREAQKSSSSKSFGSVNSFIRSYFGNPSIAFFKDVFGTKDLRNNITLKTDISSRMGQELSKQTPLLNILSRMDAYKNKVLQFTGFISRNHRFHIYNDIDFQTDKFLTRQIVRLAEPYKYSGKENVDTYLKYLSEETGYTIAEITGYDTESRERKEGRVKNLDDLIDRIGAYGEFKNVLIDFHAELGKQGFEGKFWEKYKQIDEIRKIRDLYRAKDGEVTEIDSDYLFEGDATASGLLIKLASALKGEGTKNYKTIKRMLSNYTGKDKLNDSYAISVETLFKKIDKIRESRKNNKNVTSADKEFDQIFTEALKHLDIDENNMSKGARELLKMAAMTFSYGQSADNNAIEFATTYYDKIIDGNPDIDIFTGITDLNGLGISINGKEKDRKNTNDGAFMKKVVKQDDLMRESKNELKKLLIEINEKHGSEDGTIALNKLSYTEQENYKKAMIKVLADTMGSKITGILNDSYEKDLFKDYHNQIGELYDILENIAEDDPSLIQIKSPINLLRETTKDNGADIYMKLTKLKDTLINEDVANGKPAYITQKEYANPISAKVVPIHGMDFTILMQTMKEYYGYMGKDIDDAKDNVLLIHDAVKGNAMAIEWISKRYEENIIKVTKDYDIREELVNAIERAIVEKGIKNNDIYLRDFKDLKKDVEKAVTEKKEAYKSLFYKDGTDEIVNTLSYSFRTNFETVEATRNNYDTAEDIETLAKDLEAEDKIKAQKNEVDTEENRSEDKQDLDKTNIEDDINDPFNHYPEPESKEQPIKENYTDVYQSEELSKNETAILADELFSLGGFDCL